MQMLMDKAFSCSTSGPSPPPHSSPKMPRERSTQERCCDAQGGCADSRAGTSPSTQKADSEGEASSALQRRYYVTRPVKAACTGLLAART